LSSYHFDDIFIEDYRNFGWKNLQSIEFLPYGYLDQRYAPLLKPLKQHAACLVFHIFTYAFDLAGWQKISIDLLKV
jgi:hypothetical protein